MICDTTALVSTLQEHLLLTRQLLDVVEREHQALKQTAEFPAAEFSEVRKRLLARLAEVVELIRAYRQKHRGEPRSPELNSLLRQNQDLIMRFLTLDRENEQVLLRRGLLSAARLPSINNQRPGFVAALYSRHRRPAEESYAHADREDSFNRGQSAAPPDTGGAVAGPTL